MPYRTPIFRPRNAGQPSPHNDPQRASKEPWQRWYTSRRWRNRRWVQLLESPICAECQRANPPRLTTATVVHHINQHHGNEDEFWNGPIESVCKPCHDRTIQSRERIEWLKRVGGSLARPEWLTRSRVPVTIVCGPPGAGKSTYVRTHAKPDDCVICFDAISKQLFPTIDGTRPKLSKGMVEDVLRARNQKISALCAPTAPVVWDAAWLVLTEPRRDHRQWWANTLGAKVVVLTTPAHTCRERIHLDDLAGDRRRRDAVAFVDTWWQLYKPAPCDCTG